jgi:aryl-alcohol dehydrogenase-like predicted oxidoreductase
MDYVNLGTTGLLVSRLCLGCMSYGQPDRGGHPWTLPETDARPFIQQALDLGITFFDTANVYSDGTSEEILGRAIRDFTRRDDVVLATKVHGRMRPGPNGVGLSRKHIMTEIDNSLRRLGTDYIDLYQIHRPSPDTDIDDTLGALTDLVRAGKVRYIGSSTFPAHEIVEAQYVARDRGRERFVTEQPPYSILTRSIERDVLPVCEKYGMGVIPWSPLAQGWLSGRFRIGAEVTSRRAVLLPQRYDMSLPENQRKLEAADALGQLADDAGLTLVHLAVAFVMNHPAVTAPIIGPRTMDQLETQLGAADVVLSEDILDRIDEIVPPGLTILQGDHGYEPPSIADKRTRRR